MDLKKLTKAELQEKHDKIIEVSKHLFLGSDNYSLIFNALTEVQNEMKLRNEKEVFN